MKKENNKDKLEKRKKAQLDKDIQILPKTKTAQVTIFIILALILVVSIILIVVVLRGSEKDPKIPDETNPQNYIQSCVKEAIEEGVNILVKQGGYINQINSKMYRGENISYLCYTNEPSKECVVLKSDLKIHFENEIKDYIKPRIENCFEGLKIGLEEKNYQIKQGLMDFSTEITIDKVIVNINKEFKMIKREDEKNFNKFKASYEYPLYEFSFHIMNILANEAFPENCYDNQDFDYLFYSNNNLPLQIERINHNQDKIYFLKLNEYEFKFAVRSCISPNL